MTPRYIDAHCHLQFAQYDEDREELIRKMHEEGIAGIVVGDDFESSKSAVELAEKHWHLYAAVGMHPHMIIEELFDGAKYRELARNKKVVAIGECGLDYFNAGIRDEEKQVQKELFKKHIRLAAELDKPLMIHIRPSKGSRDAYQDAIVLLQKAKVNHPNLRGNIHFFAGTREDAETFIALGFTISFTAVITFARDYDAIIRAVPLASILAETDAPFVAPAARRGQRNDPLAVIDVVSQIAAIRGEDLETVRAELLKNTKRTLSV